MVDERIAERRREVREEERLRRLRRTLFGVALLVVAAIGYGIERSPLVELSEVRVRGAERLLPEDVAAAADLRLGTSIVRLDLGAAEDRVRALPLVRDVDARRVDPLTVEISVVERVPSLVAASGRERVLIDDEGLVIAEGTEEGLPVVVLPEGADLPALGRPTSRVAVLDAAFRVHAGLRPAIAAQVPRYEAYSTDRIDLLLDSGIRVHLGRADRVDEKSRALEAVLEDIGDAPVSVIDLRAPSTPVVRS